MEPDTPVSLDTTVNLDQPVSLDTAAPGNPLPSTNTADVRSKKASYGLGELLNKSPAELYSSFARGDEQSLRIEASQKLDAMNEQSRQDQLIGMVKSQGKTLTIEQMQALRAKPTDPSAVFENGYASKFLDGIYKASASIGDTALDSATVITPDAVQVDMSKGKSAFGNIEYARTKQENAQDQYENQGWVPWAVDQAKNIVPFYSDTQLRGWMENVPAFNFQLQGNNLYTQTRELLKLPGEEFRKKYDEIDNYFAEHNPTLRLQWSNAVVGMSYGDQNMANINNIIDIAGLPGLTATARAALKNVNVVRGAIRDGIQASATVRPNPAAAAEGFGDTATAAVERGTHIIQDKIDGVYRPASNTSNLNTVNDPIRRAKEALPTNFILDKDDIAANPGPLRRELLNRILQQQDVASGRIVDVIQNIAKVQRIPLEEATRSVMTLVKEEVKNQHPGIKNAILDVGDPVYNSFGNNYNFPVRIGNWTGEQFSSEAVARKFAAEHGILEYDIAGKEGARYFLPEAAIKRPWETQSRLGEVTYKNGELKVHDDVGAEIQLSNRPQLGHIPISVDGKGKVTFHPTIKNEGELTKAVTQQQGLGFHLMTWKPLDETQHVLKDLTLQLASTKSIVSRGGPEAWANTVFRSGYARSSDNTLSPFEIHQRKTSTYSVSNYQKLLQDEMKHVEDVARGRIRVDPITGQDIGPIRSYLASITPGSKLKASKTYDEFTRTLAAATEWPHPDTGKPGYFFRSPREINDFYMTNFQRPASFQEIQGYHAFVRNYENDRVFRSVREYTNKARLGAEQHQFTVTTETGDKIKSGFFDGVSRKEMPNGEYPILDLTGDSPKINLVNKLGSRWKELSDSVRKGEHVVSEIYNPELRPMKTVPGVGNRYVRYVVSDGSARETKGLDWQQVNRLSGGHFVHDYENYVKEANIREDTYGTTKVHRYEGDTTFMAISNRAQGNQIVKVLNEVKKLLIAKDVNGAKQVFQQGLPGANGPAMEWKDFYSRTRPTKDTNGLMHPPQININEPFHVVPKNSSVMELGGELEARYTNPKTKVSTFQDGTRSGSLARQYQVGFTQERDNEGLMAMRAEGTKANPIYKYEPAKFVDPITTMNRALNQITKSSFMDDMKVAGMEAWLREAEPYLKKDFADQARAAPFHVFNSAFDRSAFAKAADPTKVSNLLSNRFKTKQFLGVPSAYDLFMHDTAQKIADSMHDTFGPKGLITPAWLMGKVPQGVKDTLYNPVAAMRGFAYHAKIGLFALPQVLTQLQSYVTIASVAPRSAVGGTIGATLHQYSRFSKEEGVLDQLDKFASKVGLPGFHKFQPGFFKEAMKELDNRGFANVGKEFSTLDTQLKHEYVKSEFGAFLDAGQAFFKYTEQHVRYGAWYTAALEYRAEHPSIKVMSRTDWDKVLDRADDLSGNMSRASASILQSGPLSLTGQFLTYQMHLGEMFWGKRLAPDVLKLDDKGSPIMQTIKKADGTYETVPEKAFFASRDRALARTRMLATYGALFGVPMGLGITGLPVSDYIRKAAIDNGYVVGDNWLSSVLMEGLPALFGAWATSDDGDIAKGNWYNVSKFGSGGFTQMNSMLSSDPKFWEFIGGASGSIMGNTLKNSSGFIRSMSSMISGNQEAFPMKTDDWVDLVKEVTSVNQSWVGITAVTTGKLFSKNEAYQGDVSKANAIFMAATGLTMTNAADNYDVGQMVKDRTEAQKYGLNRFIREYRRGILAAENDDWGNYNGYMTRAFGYLKVTDYPEDKMASAIAIASKGYETRIASIREEFYTKNVPAGQEGKKMDDYTRFLKTQDK